MKNAKTSLVKKVRSDSKVYQLKEEQREQLQCWLVDEGMSLSAAWQRAKEELGFTGSIASIQRFLQESLHQKLLERLRSGQEEAAEIAAIGKAPDLVKKAGLKIILQRFYDRVLRDESLDATSLSGWVERQEEQEFRQAKLAIRRELTELKKAKQKFREQKWSVKVKNEINSEARAMQRSLDEERHWEVASMMVEIENEQEKKRKEEWERTRVANIKRPAPPVPTPTATGTTPNAANATSKGAAKPSAPLT